MSPCLPKFKYKLNHTKNRTGFSVFAQIYEKFWHLKSDFRVWKRVLEVSAFWVPEQEVQNTFCSGNFRLLTDVNRFDFCMCTLCTFCIVHFAHCACALCILCIVHIVHVHYAYCALYTLCTLCNCALLVCIVHFVHIVQTWPAWQIMICYCWAFECSLISWFSIAPSFFTSEHQGCQESLRKSKSLTFEVQMYLWTSKVEVHIQMSF